MEDKKPVRTAEEWMAGGMRLKASDLRRKSSILQQVGNAQGAKALQDVADVTELNAAQLHSPKLTPDEQARLNELQTKFEKWADEGMDSQVGGLLESEMRELEGLWAKTGAIKLD